MHDIFESVVVTKCDFHTYRLHFLSVYEKSLYSFLRFSHYIFQIYYLHHKISLAQDTK